MKKLNCAGNSVGAKILAANMLFIVRGACGAEIAVGVVVYIKKSRQ